MSDASPGLQPEAEADAWPLGHPGAASSHCRKREEMVVVHTQAGELQTEGPAFGGVTLKDGNRDHSEIQQKSIQ